MGQEPYRGASGVLVVFPALLTSSASPLCAQGQEGASQNHPDSPFLTPGFKSSGQRELGPEYLQEGKSLGK